MICLLCKSTQDPIVLITSTIPTKQKLPIFFLFSNLKTSHPEMVLKAFTSYHFIHSMNYFILDPNQQQSATSGTRCLMKEREGGGVYCGNTDKPGCLFCDHRRRRKQGTRKTYIMMKGTQVLIYLASE